MIHKDFNWNKFAIDLETNNRLRLKTINLTDEKTYKNGISLSDGTYNYYFNNEDHDLQQVINILKTKSKETKAFKGSLIIFHNSAFDAPILEEHGIQIGNADFYDTMVACHLINEEDEKSLKKLSMKYLGREDLQLYDKNMTKKEFIEYSLLDSQLTYELYEYTEPLIEEHNLTLLFYKIEMPFQKVIMEMHLNGFNINKNKVIEHTNTLKELRGKELINLCKLTNTKYSVDYDLLGNYTINTRVNFDSTTQLKTLLIDNLGYTSKYKTPAGKVSLGKKFLDDYKNKSELIASLFKYKKISKLLTGFFNPLPSFIDSDNCVRTSYNDCGAKTGRLSSRSPNLQQLGKDNDKLGLPSLREVFKASNGYTMITADYSGQEVVIAAHISKDPVLLDILRKGKDMHLTIANQFYNLGIAEEDLYSTSPNFEELKEHTYSKQRSMAKSITFGLLYGKTSHGLAEDFNISEEEAQGLINDYFDALPTLKEYIDETHEEVNNQGYVSTLVNRMRHFQKIKGYYPGSAYRQSFNFKVQSFGADMIRIAGVRLLNLKRRQPDLGLRIIGTVHDEWIVEVKKDKVNKAVPLIKEALEGAVKLSVPINCGIGIGDNYSQAK